MDRSYVATPRRSGRRLFLRTQQTLAGSEGSAPAGCSSTTAGCCRRCSRSVRRRRRRRREQPAGPRLARLCRRRASWTRAATRQRHHRSGGRRLRCRPGARRRVSHHLPVRVRRSLSRTPCSCQSQERSSRRRSTISSTPRRWVLRATARCAQGRLLLSFTLRV
eukprot:SAG22_NODE_69_length_22779_cov_71.088139_6_plen_164_part_00